MTAVEAENGWSGTGVTLGEVETRLARLRAASGSEALRTSVATHIAWAPPGWLEAALGVLEGLGGRHPSRTIVLVPEPESDEDRIDASVSLTRIPLGGDAGDIVSETILLRLFGATARRPASIVMPLLVSDLPVFCRWRGEPCFGQDEFEQLVGVADRLIVDSDEWDDLPWAFGPLAALIPRIAVSDIAWERIAPWQLAVAGLWPAVADADRLRVSGPLAEALLLRGWLESRLSRKLELERVDAPAVSEMVVGGHEVPPPPPDNRSPSDLLSDELDRFGHDPLYEDAITALI